MTPNDIIKYCLEQLADVVEVISWGERSIFYNPGGVLKRGVYVMTIKEKDGPNDNSSKLNRDGIWRVNIGIRQTTFQQRFGDLPKRPGKGGIVNMPYDFTTLDTILPHPVYAWMGWVSVLNPSSETFDHLKPLINEAYEFAQEKLRKRQKLDL